MFTKCFNSVFRRVSTGNNTNPIVFCKLVSPGQSLSALTPICTSASSASTPPFLSLNIPPPFSASLFAMSAPRRTPPAAAYTAACKLPPESSGIKYVSAQRASAHTTVSSRRGDSAPRALASSAKQPKSINARASSTTQFGAPGAVAADAAARESGGIGVSPSPSSASTCAARRVSHHNSSNNSLGS